MLGNDRQFIIRQHFLISDALNKFLVLGVVDDRNQED